MTRAEVSKSLAAIGDARRAYTSLSGRRQQVVLHSWSVDQKHVIVLTPAGNSVYRTPRQLVQSDSL
jgi:hypothetical protein